MNSIVYDWFKRTVAAHIDCRDKSVLDVGSLDINGSLKPIFMEAGATSYTGIDIRPGPGVDIVMNAHNLLFADNSYDIVVSGEMLEHDSHFWQTAMQIGRVLKPGGWFVLSARGNGFPLHLHPDDFYRFMPSSYYVIFELARCHTVLVEEDPNEPGLFGLGWSAKT